MTLSCAGIGREGSQFVIGDFIMVEKAEEKKPVKAEEKASPKAEKEEAKEEKPAEEKATKAEEKVSEEKEEKPAEAAKEVAPVEKREHKEPAHKPRPSEKPKRGKHPKKTDFVELKPAELTEAIVHLANEGHTAAEIGMILRDQYGIPKVSKVTGKKLGAILAENKLTGAVPEDLMNLIRKSVTLREHLAKNKKDMSAKRGLMLTVSKIRAIEKYYKKRFDAYSFKD